jgi:hypothetical protein
VSLGARALPSASQAGDHAVLYTLSVWLCLNFRTAGASSGEGGGAWGCTARGRNLPVVLLMWVLGVGVLVSAVMCVGVGCMWWLEWSCRVATTTLVVQRRHGVRIPLGSWVSDNLPSWRVWLTPSP